MDKNLTTEQQQFLYSSIRNIADFPKVGIQFKDITTLLNNARAYATLIEHLTNRYIDRDLDYIAGIESRGFIFGAALAAQLKIGFVPIRKPHKLPAKTISASYELEYGSDTLEIHADAFPAINGHAIPRVLLIDDLIATGGTAIAAIDLITKAHANCVEACFLIELSNLPGAQSVKALTNFYSILNYAD